MGRPLRAATGGLVYHVLNRANGRRLLFKQPEDYEAFERVLVEAHERVNMRTLAYCVMPNHWHLVLWPRGDRDLSEFMGWLTLTHTQRWHASHRTAGAGHLYQGRFKSFPIESDDYFLTVCRYAERNPLRANLVSQPDEWRWSSLWRWKHGDAEARKLLSEWPVRRPRKWLDWVAQPQTEAELQALRQCLNRGRPFGSDAWVQHTSQRLGLESTLRPRGRPRKEIP